MVNDGKIKAHDKRIKKAVRLSKRAKNTHKIGENVVNKRAKSGKIKSAEFYHNSADFILLFGQNKSKC
jgi:hypothetical protein